MEMRVLALTRYESLGSSSRVRFYQYVPYLESRGVEIVTSPLLDNNYVRGLYSGTKTPLRSILFAYAKRLNTLLLKGSFDLLWVEKELLPWFPSLFEAFCRASHPPYVVDYDDAVFHRYDMHSRFFVRALLGKKIDHVMRNAGLVIVGNDYLGDRALKAGARRVEYLPSVVDVGQYHTKLHRNVSTFHIGWIGSPLTARYLNLIREVIHQLNQESNIHMVLMGAGSQSPYPHVPTEILPWSEETESLLSHKIDVGIMPLVDEPFERGKCGYKLVQYMAGGIPVVASPIGVNRQMVEPGINGYLANSTDDWLHALRSIRDNLELRAAMGKAGHQKAKKLYNLEVTAPRLLTFLSAAAGS